MDYIEHLTVIHECSCIVEFIKQGGKEIKMCGLLSSLSHFLNEFNKFNNTGAQILDSIYHMALKLMKSHFCCENVKILSLCMLCCYGSH